MNYALKKTIVWRCLSLSTALTIGRVWFGDWHVTWFSLFLTVLLTVMYYTFERIYPVYTKEYNTKVYNTNYKNTKECKELTKEK